MHNYIIPLTKSQKLFVHIEEIKGEVFMSWMSRISDTNGWLGCRIQTEEKEVKKRWDWNRYLDDFIWATFGLSKFINLFMIENWNRSIKVSLFPIFFAGSPLPFGVFVPIKPLCSLVSVWYIKLPREKSQILRASLCD